MKKRLIYLFFTVLSAAAFFFAWKWHAENTAVMSGIIGLCAVSAVVCFYGVIFPDKVEELFSGKKKGL